MIRHCCALLLLFLIAEPSVAQGHAANGYVFGTGGPGLIHEFGNGIGVRPTFGYTRTTTTSGTTTSTTQSWSLAVDVPKYFDSHDGVRPYVAPRIAYTNQLTGSAKQELWTYGAAVGASYAATQRFSVFGDMGLTYGTQKVTSNVVGTIWATRSALGIVWYFGQ
jgi:opacity protein-like surface antigen